MIENLPRARSEKDITRVSGTLSTGSIPVGRANVFSYLETSREKVSAKVPVFSSTAGKLRCSSADPQSTKHDSPQRIAGSQSGQSEAHF